MFPCTILISVLIFVSMIGVLGQVHPSSAKIAFGEALTPVRRNLLPTFAFIVIIFFQSFSVRVDTASPLVRMLWTLAV